MVALLTSAMPDSEGPVVASVASGSEPVNDDDQKRCPLVRVPSYGPQFNNDSPATEVFQKVWTLAVLSIYYSAIRGAIDTSKALMFSNFVLHFHKMGTVVPR